MKTLRTSLRLLVAVGLALHTSVLAQVVTTPADSGAGSLRDTTAGAAPGDAITFTHTLSGLSILLTRGQVTVDRNLNIDASVMSQERGDPESTPTPTPSAGC